MAVQWIKNGWQQEKFCAVGGSMTSQPCPFDLGLRKFALNFLIVIFFKNAKKITSGGLIMSLEKFGSI